MRIIQIDYTWRIAGSMLVILLLLTLGIYHETVIGLIELWNELGTGNYTHGYLVLGISAYLILGKRLELAALAPRPNYWALIAVTMTSALWMIAALVDVEMLQSLALLLIVLSIVWVVLGTQISLLLLFPILFICFAIPIWFPLSPVLQDVTADVVFRLVRILSIPAMRVENIIVLPSGKLSIEEACGGLNYLLAALTLSTLYAYLNYSTIRARAIVVLVAVSAAVLSNIVRVLIVVYLAYRTDMQHPIVHDHITLGWCIFGAMVVMLLVIDYRLQNYYPVAENMNSKISDRVQNVYQNGSVQLTLFFITSILLVTSGPVLAFWAGHQSQSYPTGQALEFPPGTGGWSGPMLVQDDWHPDYKGAISRKLAYKKNNQTVYLYIGVYRVQKQGSELINDLNRINNSDIWKSHYTGTMLVESKIGNVLEQLLEKDAYSRRLVWYWYRVAGQNTASKYVAKALQVLGLLTNEQSMIIAIAADTSDMGESERVLLDEFVSDIGPGLIDAVSVGSLAKENKI